MVALSGDDAPAPPSRAEIEASLGVKLSELPPELLQLAVEGARKAGNDAFKAKQYERAVTFYCQAVAGAENDKVLRSNLSAAYLALGRADDAAADAARCVELDPAWPKGYFRLGNALAAQQRWAAAAETFAAGAALDPASKELAVKLAEARERAVEERGRAVAQVAATRREVVLQLRAARHADAREALLTRLRQGLSGPEWDVSDHEWRPTFLPAMRERPLRRAAFESDPRRRLVRSYVNALGELAQPKAALAVLADVPRLEAYEAAIEAAAADRPGAHVLVLGAGTGILSLMAARAWGTAAAAIERSGTSGSPPALASVPGPRPGPLVTSIERSRMLFRMAKQALEANTVALQQRPGEAPLPPLAPVHLVDRALEACWAPGGGPTPAVEAAASGAAPPDADTAPPLASRADLLLTDLLDAGAFGHGLLPAVDHAAEHLLAAGAAVLPARVAVFARLLELRVRDVSGLDLSYLNVYRWHPRYERLQLDTEPIVALSEPFRVCEVDLQARVEAVQARVAAAAAAAAAATGTATAAAAAGGDPAPAAPKPAVRPASSWELDTELEVLVTRGGVWNAVAFWFELDLGPAGGCLASYDPPPSTVTPSGPSAASQGAGGAVGSADGGAVDPDAHGAAPVDGSAIAGAARRVARSWGQAVQFLDEQPLAAGALAQLRARRDGGQMLFGSLPPATRPRQAHVPRWHYDMLRDGARNDAYERAVRKAIATRRAMDPSVGRDRGGRELTVLDVGAGSGLLSMLAARSGADSVVGIEVSPHMADVGEECEVMNGFAAACRIVHADARRVMARDGPGLIKGGLKPDGTLPELEQQADVLVYEVFDSGLIGEGCLHLVALAQQRLLRPGAALVPAAARVWAQPIELRVGAVRGFDYAAANRWRWRPDYEGVELGQLPPGTWRPLAPPAEVFAFDFYAQQSAAASAPLEFAIGAAGVFNAVAFWFDLQLDDAGEITLSTSPHPPEDPAAAATWQAKGPTWQQAVQFMEELRVEPGQCLPLLASHDSYGISFAVRDGALPRGRGRADAATGVPLWDPVWKVAHENLQRVNGSIAKAVSQSPLEMRAVAEAALQLATRPADLGADPEQAADFCLRMFS